MTGHPPPPTRYGPGLVQRKVGELGRPQRSVATKVAAPPTRYGAAAAAQAKAVPSGPRPAAAVVQRMERTPFQLGSESVVETWESYNSAQKPSVKELRTRTLAGIVTHTDDVFVGTSGWDGRGEHEKSSEVFGPALEPGRNTVFGISCGEKDSMLSLLEGAFQGNYASLKSEHERCSSNYFKIIREKLNDRYGSIKGVVSVYGAVTRSDLTYAECCPGCYNLLVRRCTRLYSVPDLVRGEKRHNTKL